MTTTARYEIQGRTDAYTSGWNAEALGTDHTTFETREEAQAAIEGLHEMNPTEFPLDEMRIVEITETPASNTKTWEAEKQIEKDRRAAWAAANPDKCANCGGTGYAWNFVHSLGDKVMDLCKVCGGSGWAD